MDVVFLISHFPDPRMNKRILISKNIADTALIFWDRKTVRIWNVVHLDIENIKISVRADYTNPLKRIVPTIKFGFRAIKKLIKFNPKCLYITNIDMLIIASIYSLFKKKNPQIIYEIADLNSLIADKHTNILKKIIKRILIKIEKCLCRKINTLVVTSSRFYDMYYSEFIVKEKVLFLPNMPNLLLFKNYIKKTNGDFTVGFIGAVRYKEQMKMLIKACYDCNIKLLFAGAGLDNEIEKLCCKNNNIIYYGKYNYKSEISNLYSKVDCIYAVYNADLQNVKMALPNKLYESIICELPIIVAKKTFLSEIVENIGVGLSISHNSLDELKTSLSNLKNNRVYYNTIVKNCRDYKNKINLDLYNNKLKDKLYKIINNNE